MATQITTVEEAEVELRRLTGIYKRATKESTRAKYAGMIFDLTDKIEYWYDRFGGYPTYYPDPADLD